MKVYSQDKLKKVVIEIENPSPKGTFVTVTDADTIKKLFETIYALPKMPKDIACTLARGTDFTLRFFDESGVVSWARAENYGCRPVTIQDQKQTRQATQQFWDVLGEAIYEATPKAQVTQLAVRHITQNDKPGRTALYASIEAQQLYDAILKLPLAVPNKPCHRNREYQMVFTAADHTISVHVSNQCHQILLRVSVAGRATFQSRSGDYQMNEQFEQYLADFLKHGTYSITRADSLMIHINDYKGHKRDIKVTDTMLIQKLFEKIYSLPSTERPEDCPTDDERNANLGTYYFLDFSQWNLRLGRLTAYKGTCTAILPYPTDINVPPFLVDDQEFWNLVVQAAGER